MYGRRSVATPKGGEPAAVPQGYSEWGEPGPEGGRPREKASVYGTNDGLGGRHPLGQHGMHGGFPSDADNVNENMATKSIYQRNEGMLKQIVFKKKPGSDDNDLLNEDNIKDLGK